jgi:hypothetical protein
MVAAMTPFVLAFLASGAITLGVIALVDKIRDAMKDKGPPVREGPPGEVEQPSGFMRFFTKLTTGLTDEKLDEILKQRREELYNLQLQDYADQEARVKELMAAGKSAQEAQIQAQRELVERKYPGTAGFREFGDWRGDQGTGVAGATSGLSKAEQNTLLDLVLADKAPKPPEKVSAEYNERMFKKVIEDFQAGLPQTKEGKQYLDQLGDSAKKTSGSIDKLGTSAAKTADEAKKPGPPPGASEGGTPAPYRMPPSNADETRLQAAQRLWGPGAKESDIDWSIESMGGPAEHGWYFRRGTGIDVPQPGGGGGGGAGGGGEPPKIEAKDVAVTDAKITTDKVDSTGSTTIHTEKVTVDKADIQSGSPPDINVNTGQDSQAGGRGGSEVPQQWAGGLIDSFLGGGLVGGYGSGKSDSNMVRVSKGEFVVTADGGNLGAAIAHFSRGFAEGGLVGGFMDAMRVPSYASGGVVTATGGGDGGGGRPIELHIGGEKIVGLTATEDAASAISRVAVDRAVRSGYSGGGKSSWYRGN